jgi:hypothetical protein
MIGTQIGNAQYISNGRNAWTPCAIPPRISVSNMITTNKTYRPIAIIYILLRNTLYIYALRLYAHIPVTYVTLCNRESAYLPVLARSLNKLSLFQTILYCSMPMRCWSTGIPYLLHVNFAPHCHRQIWHAGIHVSTELVTIGSINKMHSSHCICSMQIFLQQFK